MHSRDTFLFALLFGLGCAGLLACTQGAEPVAVAEGDDSVRAFTYRDRGGSSEVTDGIGNLSVGYARIQPDQGTPAPAGVAIFGLRMNNTLVSEAGVPPSPLLTQGRIYAEVIGSLNTGLAIANPNASDATISFTFTDSRGVDFRTGTTTIAANGQIAKFLDQDPFFGLTSRTSLQGTFTFTSSVPVSVTALRGLTNERGEFLITTLPVVNTSAVPKTGMQVLPHFADGAGWTTSIILVNPSDDRIDGVIQFFGRVPGDAFLGPGIVNINGQFNQIFGYRIPGKSSEKLSTLGVGLGPSGRSIPTTTITSGSVRITPYGGGDQPAPVPMAVFSFKWAGVTVSEAGASSIQGTAFRMYVESLGISGAPGNIQTGIAVANTVNATANVTLELTRLDGTSTNLTESLTVPRNGQVARFLSEIFPSLPQPFQGVLRITSSTSMSIVGLRGQYNASRDFLITTTPPAVEDAAPSFAELNFPHIVNGGGYTTQFILFSGTAGQSGSGNLRFLRQDGSPFSLTFK